MSMELWTPRAGMSAIAFEGHLEFRDMFIPTPAKDEWGADTLERLVQGPASRFEDYGSKLKQGQVYDGNKFFFLQTWRAIDHKCFPGYALSYKGFIDDKLPDPIPSTSRSELMSSISAIDLDITDGGRTITSGVAEMKYIAPTTIWRYISRGEPDKKRFGGPGSVRGVMGIENLSTLITANYDDGSSAQFAGNAPAGLATALFATPFIFTIGPSFSPIWGTPFFECDEICQYKYPDS